MTKDELATIVDLAVGNWSPGMTAPEKLKMLKTWHHFLGDLDGPVLLLTVERSAMTDKFMPRPGELRAKVLAPDVPTAEEAWQQAAAALDAARYGIPTPDLHPLVAETIRENKLGGIHELSFKPLYETRRLAHLESLTP